MLYVNNLALSVCNNKTPTLVLHLEHKKGFQNSRSICY
jgi:hypothetical protein